MISAINPITDNNWYLTPVRRRKRSNDLLSAEALRYRLLRRGLADAAIEAYEDRAGDELEENSQTDSFQDELRDRYSPPEWLREYHRLLKE